MKALIMLRDKEIYPSDHVLEQTLGGDIYSILKLFLGTITSHEYGLTVEWRFYNDGKAWLGKTVNKKKTVFWLSIWDGFFKASFFFTEKHLEAIARLDVDEMIKQEFALAKPVGKLIPMIFDIKTKNQLQDLLTVVQFKMGLK